MKAYRLGLYEKAMPESLAWAEKLSHAAEAGYDYLEISIDETERKLARLDWPEREIVGLLRAQQEAGLPILSMCLSGHRRFPLGDPDRDVRQQGLIIMKKAIRMAEKLGVRIIQLAGYDVYYKPGSEETRAYFGENLAKAVNMAAASGVVLAFETMETEFMNTTSKAMEWVNTIDSPWLQVYPDLGNITNAFDADSTAVQADLETARGHLAAMHLKETKPGIFRELSYGEGHVDFYRGASVAYGMGVRMFVCECWHTDQVQDWKQTIVENARFLRAVLDKAVTHD